MKLNLLLFTFILGVSFSCSSFKAKRVGAEESDELAMNITDNWLQKDTEITVKDILKQIKNHKGFQRYMRNRGNKAPKLFIGEVQNLTSEAYFPIDDLNDELLNEFSYSGDYILIDAAARDKILKEIKYQNDGMVNPAEAKSIGKASGADLMIFGAVRMKAESRKGKTIKQYSVNIRMTDIEKGEEVLRTRSKDIQKFSDKSSYGW